MVRPRVSSKCHMGRIGLPIASVLSLAALLLIRPGSVAAVSPFIVYRCGDGSANLCRINPDGSGQTALTSDGRPGSSAYGSPSLARDGSRLAFITPPRKQMLCLLKADNTDCERVVARDDRRDLTDPAVSPDGKLLAVAGCAEPKRVRGGLSVYDMGSGAKLRDLTGGTSDTAPAWSPDGSMLVFTRANDLFVVPADGGPGADCALVRDGRDAMWGGSAEVVLATPTPVAEPVAEPIVAPPAPPAPSDADAVALAVQTAAEQLQVPAEPVTVQRVEPTDWPELPSAARNPKAPTRRSSRPATWSW